MNFSFDFSLGSVALVAGSDAFMPSLSSVNSTGGYATNCAGSLLAYAANEIRYGCLDGKRAIVVEAGATILIPDNTAASTAFNYEGRADWEQDTALAPDGISQADKLFATAEDGSHYSRVRDYGTDNSPVTFSVCLKAGELDSASLAIYDADAAGNQFRADLNLATGEISNGAVFGNAVLLDMKATPLIDGWTLFSISGNPNTGGAGGSVFVQLTLVKNGSASFLGDGAEGIHVWLPDLKQVANFSTPILSTGTPASRAADLVTAPLTGDYTNGVRVRGTFRLEGAIGNNDRIFNMDDGNGSERLLMYWYNPSDEFRIDMLVGGVTQAQVIYSGAGLGDVLDVDLTFTASGIVGTINGDAVSASGLGGYTPPTTMRLGRGTLGADIPARLLCSKLLVSEVAA